MQINIATRHGHLSDASQAKIKSKLERLPRLFERLTAIEVTVDLEHAEMPSVDIRVDAEHKHDFVASERAEDLMQAVDLVIHKIEQQIRKYKQKVQDHHKSPGLRQQGVPADPEASGE